jgi:hypothetical protein
MPPRSKRKTIVVSSHSLGSGIIARGASYLTVDAPDRAEK